MEAKKRVAICFIGTNKYLNFFETFYRSIKKLFLPDCEKTIFLFTDGPVCEYPDVKTVAIEHQPWPFITLQRFETILKVEQELKEFDWFVYLDADMLVNTKISFADFFNTEKKWFGVQHPGFLNGGGTFEFRKKSKAAVNPATDDISTYWQGCLWGGKIEPVIELCKELSSRTNVDLQNNLIAIWHDESHLNKFYIENKQHVHTLNAGFAYPEKWQLPFRKNILHVHKGFPSPEEFLRSQQ